MHVKLELRSYYYNIKRHNKKLTMTYCRYTETIPTLHHLSNQNSGVLHLASMNKKDFIIYLL